MAIVVQLTGYAAFIAASAVLAVRLLALWRRTREWPELTIGASFALGGVAGHVAWLGIGVLGGPQAAPEAVHRVATFGLAATMLGAVCNGVGIALIFRAGKRWAALAVAAVAVWMFVSWLIYAGRPAGEGTPHFWRALSTLAPLYLWGAVESFSLAGVLRKRSRLGLADPLVVNRITQFGVCNTAVVASIAVAYSAAQLWGPRPPVWTSTLTSTSLLVAGAAIWIGFFPPSAYRTRLQRAHGAD